MVFKLKKGFSDAFWATKRCLDKINFFRFFKKISISTDKLPMKRRVDRQTMSRKIYKLVEHPISYILTVLECFYDKNSLLCVRLKKFQKTRFFEIFGQIRKQTEPSFKVSVLFFQIQFVFFSKIVFFFNFFS